MELNIFWTEAAKTELLGIFKYYRKVAGLISAKKIVSGIVTETTTLALSPQIGQIEELLVGLKEEYRYLIHQNYKIIYWINNVKSQVEIVDVFDTRQNPIKIIRLK